MKKMTALAIILLWEMRTFPADREANSPAFEAKSPISSRGDENNEKTNNATRRGIGLFSLVFRFSRAVDPPSAPHEKPINTQSSFDIRGLYLFAVFVADGGYTRHFKLGSNFQVDIGLSLGGHAGLVHGAAYVMPRLGIKYGKFALELSRQLIIKDLSDDHGYDSTGVALIYDWL